jgi:hypothetical protein
MLTTLGTSLSAILQSSEHQNDLNLFMIFVMLAAADLQQIHGKLSEPAAANLTDIYLRLLFDTRISDGRE